MLCESMEGAHGSTPRGNPHTITVLFLKLFDSLIVLTLLKWKSRCRKVVEGLISLGDLQRDTTGNKFIAEEAILQINFFQCSYLLYFIYLLMQDWNGTAQFLNLIVKRAGPL